MAHILKLRIYHFWPNYFSKLSSVETAIPSSNVIVEVFHELCVYKNKNNYCWSDVSSWMKAMVPEDLKMKCTPDRMKYLNQKVTKIYQTCMENRNTDELKEFKSTIFFQIFE